MNKVLLCEECGVFIPLDDNSSNKIVDFCLFHHGHTLTRAYVNVSRKEVEQKEPSTC